MKTSCIKKKILYMRPTNYNELKRLTRIIKTSGENMEDCKSNLRVEYRKKIYVLLFACRNIFKVTFTAWHCGGIFHLKNPQSGRNPILLLTSFILFLPVKISWS